MFKSILYGLLFFGIFAPVSYIAGGKYAVKNLSKVKTESQLAVTDLKMPKHEVLQSVEVKKYKPAKRTVTLEAGNLLILKGPVTTSSMSTLQNQLMKMSLKLSKNTTIYLVLDTPGGSIFAGLNAIDHFKAVPQRIETITLFAASMGFQFVQNMDKRLITPTGTLMSHRARGGVNGQFDGELESRYKMVKRAISYLDVIASKRMKISLKSYKKLIKDEYWVYGFDSVQESAADEMVNVSCGKSLSGSYWITLQTFFGSVEVELSKCPLIRGMLGYKFGNASKDNKVNLMKAINSSMLAPASYVKDYIITGKHYKIFK